MNVAAKCRIEKEAHPERYCAHPRCLWKIQTALGPNPCRNHPELAAQPVAQQVTKETVSK